MRWASVSGKWKRIYRVKLALLGRKRRYAYIYNWRWKGKWKYVMKHSEIDRGYGIRTHQQARREVSEPLWGLLEDRRKVAAEVPIGTWLPDCPSVYCAVACAVPETDCSLLRATSSCCVAILLLRATTWLQARTTILTLKWSYTMPLPLQVHFCGWMSSQVEESPTAERSF